MTNYELRCILQNDSERYGETMSYPKLNKYTVYMKLTVWGETPEDAFEYANSAIDASELLTQDGVIGIEFIDDEDSIEVVEDDNESEDDEDY